MAKRIVWLLLLGGMLTQLFAQEDSPPVTPITLLDTAFLMSPLSKKEFSYYFYEEGDVLFTLTAAEKPLLYVEVEEVPGIYKFSAFKTDNVEETIANEAHSLYRFKFRNSSSFRFRYINIKIQHIPAPLRLPVVARDTIYDTIYAETITKKVYVNDIKTITVRDSVRTEAVSLSEEMIPLAAFRAFPNEGRKRVKIKFPSDRRILSWAYWIGVGEGSEQFYANLQGKLPPEWADEGITSPLHAYAVGRLSSLPKPNAGEQVAFAFLNPRQADQFDQKGWLDSILVNGPDRAIVDYKRMDYPPRDCCEINLGLENTNTVTAISVYVKVIAIVEEISYITPEIKK